MYDPSIEKPVQLPDLQKHIIHLRDMEGFSGSINLHKIALLSKSLNIGGLENLQQLDKKASGKIN